MRLIAGINIETKKLMPWDFLGTRVIGPFLTKRLIPNEAAVILSQSVPKNHGSFHGSRKFPTKPQF